MQKATLDLAFSGNAKKGDVFAAARIAAIMAAKKAHDLIPLCHPLALTKVTVDLEPDTDLPGIRVRVLAKVLGQTGVEMEALTGVSVACLTIYDMLKAADRAMRIEKYPAGPQERRQIGRFCARRGDFAGMSGGGLLSVAQARARILSSVSADRPVESIALECASGRTLARDLVAQLTQPPKAMSAMDGYAVRTEDLARLPVKLKQIGESTAGHGFQGAIGPGETVRIFTGAPVPVGLRNNFDPGEGPSGGRFR